MPSHRELRTPTHPNIFHGLEYPLTLWFFEDCYDRDLKPNEWIGIHTLERIVRPPNGVIERAYLYWMIDLDGTGSVHSLGRKREE